MAINKFFIGIFVLTIFGFTVVGCGNDSTNNNGNNNSGIAKKITITGLNGRTGPMQVKLEGENGAFIAEGDEYISGNSVTVNLEDNEGEWTGSGSYYIYIFLLNDPFDYDFVYTAGQTLDELGFRWATFYEKLPKYNISSEVTSIDFSQFVKLEYR